MLAYLPTGQGRVGLFLLFGFYLEVLERKMVLQGCGAAGQQAVGIMLRTLGVNLLALPLFPKEYISSRGRGLSAPLSGPPSFVPRRGALCMVPSPLCGRLATSVDLIRKTRIKNYNFLKAYKLVQTLFYFCA